MKQRVGRWLSTDFENQTELENYGRGVRMSSVALKKLKSSWKPKEVTAAEIMFLSTISKEVTTTDATNILETQRIWLEFVRTKVEIYPSDELQSVLRLDTSSTPDHVPKRQLMTACFIFLAQLTEITADQRNFSIDKCLADLSTSAQSCLHPDILQGPHRDSARKLVFCGISWITMLYPADSAPASGTNVLRVCNDQCNAYEFTQPASHADRPICEVLRDFGPLIPGGEEESGQNLEEPSRLDMQDQGFDTTSLYVSLLNASTLWKLAEIQIEWIDNIGSHLQFDPDGKRLMMFRLPSYCDVPRAKPNSISRILTDYHDEFDRVTALSYDKVFKEVRRSYQLIFSDDSSSRHRFNTKERRRLRELGIVDPLLVKLCSVSSNSRRNSYNRATEFRIFQSRLSLLQDYIKRQQPSSILMIWRDKRNVEKWWTFWAVVLFGSIGVLLSLAQVALAGAQVYYARNPVKQF